MKTTMNIGLDAGISTSPAGCCKAANRWVWRLGGKTGVEPAKPCRSAADLPHTAVIVTGEGSQ
jgi:hypothetical protein